MACGVSFESARRCGRGKGNIFSKLRNQLNRRADTAAYVLASVQIDCHMTEESIRDDKQPKLCPVLDSQPRKRPGKVA